MIEWKETSSNLFGEIYKAEIQEFSCLAAKDVVNNDSVWVWSVERNHKMIGFGSADSADQAKQCAENIIASAGGEV